MSWLRRDEGGRAEASAERSTVDQPLKTPPLASSFEDFFELEHEALFAALYLLTGNRSDAEDLMQLAFLKLWERWNWVQEMDSPTGYLYRTAMNCFRSQRRRTIMAARKAVRPAAGTDPLDRVAERDDVDRALAALSRRQREAVVLVDLFQYPADEAARLMGIAPSTLRVQLARGRERVRNELGGGGD
jgi:RNA polymerase sigma factor (sigma-70 family)